MNAAITAIAYATMPKKRYKNMQKHAAMSHGAWTLDIAAQNCPICPVTTR